MARLDFVPVYPELMLEVQHDAEFALEQLAIQKIIVHKVINLDLHVHANADCSVSA